MCWLRQQAQPFCQNVFCNVSVHIVNSAAGRTNPLPDKQVLCAWLLGTTEGTYLQGWKESVHRDHLFPILHRLILQMPPELTQPTSEIDQASFRYFWFGCSAPSEATTTDFSLMSGPIIAPAEDNDSVSTLVQHRATKYFPLGAGSQWQRACSLGLLLKHGISQFPVSEAGHSSPQS